MYDLQASLGIQLHLLEVYLPELSATIVSSGDHTVPVADLVEPCLTLFAGTTEYVCTNLFSEASVSQYFVSIIKGI